MAVPGLFPFIGFHNGLSRLSAIIADLARLGCGGASDDRRSIGCRDIVFPGYHGFLLEKQKGHHPLSGDGPWLNAVWLLFARLHHPFVVGSRRPTPVIRPVSRVRLMVDTAPPVRASVPRSLMRMELMVSEA